MIQVIGACICLATGGLDPAADLPADLAAVPGDARLFLCIQVPDLLKTEVFRRYLGYKDADQAKVAAEVAKEVGLTLGEVERVTAFVKDSRTVVLVRNSRPMQHERIAAQWAPGSTPL